MARKGNSIAALRKEYSKRALLEKKIAANPFAQFELWFEEAIAAKLVEPNAMTLATADAAGKPSARVVLLKEWDKEGFCFFTNYKSRKGRELAARPEAALLFYWSEVERQVRIQGRVEKLSRAHNKEYFASRPHGAQIGAIASNQSSVLKSRKELEAQVKDLERASKKSAIECPEHWGGYRLLPDYFEFWQGRENRLHDRIEYRRSKTSWVISRLYP